MLGRAIAACVIASSAIAAADPSPEASRREADEHARRGVALYKLGRYLEAIDEFEQAYVLYPSDALLYNLGQSHRQLDHCREALDYYKRFLDGSPDAPLAPKVRELLPPLERACAVKLEKPVEVTGAIAMGTSSSDPPAPAPAPAVAITTTATAAPPIAPTEWTVRGGLGAGVLSSGGAAAAPVGPVLAVTHAFGDGRFDAGAHVGAGVFAGDPGATASAFELLAIGGRSIARDELTFSAYGGAGVLVLSELPHTLGAGGRTVRGSIAVPEVAALASIDRSLDQEWTIGAGAEVAVGGASGLRGGVSIAAALTINLGYRR
ncbi:MAG TPA: tetratricopeptide repeat protein [Kofleriaceae bacterium]|nr:tetratricopeptide repeat protein [Kofleriaceae bacterium]